MSTPADFLRFFETTFAEALRATEIPGLDGASWDRKAAWLLWINTDEGRAFVPPLSEMPIDIATTTDMDIFS